MRTAELWPSTIQGVDWPRRGLEITYQRSATSDRAKEVKHGQWIIRLRSRASDARTQLSDACGSASDVDELRCACIASPS